MRLFRFDEEDVPTQLRAQRKLNEKRSKAIGEYVIKNRADYVLPALTASCDTAMRFDPIGVPGSGTRLGMLHIPLTSSPPFALRDSGRGFPLQGAN
ncbi:DNA sulfur modification protein DndB [Marinobacterium stanieri]|uniref:DNA sulfur modification protein DndB n=1 Tax=Marinobacterium stanieri TaxID=49186 RepID=UPI003B83942B